MDVELSGGEEYDNLVAPIKKCCQFIAVWPLDSSDINENLTKLKIARKLQISYRIFIISYMLTLAIVQMIDVYYNWGNMEEFTESCLVISTIMLTVFRSTMYSLQHNNLCFILKRMRYDWVSASEKDKIILREKCLSAFIMAKYFIICISVTMSLVFVLPIIKMSFIGFDKRLLPYNGYSYFNITQAPNYQIMYGVKILGGIYGLCNVAGLNSLNLVTIIHGSAKFLLLQNHINLLKSNDKHSDQLLRNFIQEHQQAIEFANILEEIINKIALGQFIISTGLVCFAGLQITEMIDNKMHLILHVAYLTSAIFELFIFSYSGYQLTFESQSVGNSAFNCDWIGSTFTQNLHIVMMRSTKPNKITAARFYDMSLESFSMILSTSFSYFTTLRAVNED